jgi:hypothetical protein
MKAKRRERVIAIVALVCIGLVAIDKLIVPPLRDVWTTRSDRVKRLQLSLKKGRILVDREQAMRERWADMEQHCLPADESAAENLVLKSVSTWTSKSQFNVSSLKPRWVEDRKVKDHKKLLFHATGEGRPGEVWRFLYELERDPLALKVEDVEITARDQRGAVMALGVRFSGIVLEDEEQ